MKKLSALTLALLLALALTACGGGTPANGSTDVSSGRKVTLQIGFENSSGEPIGQGLAKWQELLSARDTGLESPSIRTPSWETSPPSLIP